LDTAPPKLARRGAAAERAAELDDVSGKPDPAGEVRRRKIVLKDQLVAAGVMERDDPVPVGAVAIGSWLIDSTHFSHWHSTLRQSVDEWAKAHPLAPGMPPTTVIQRLELPAAAVLEALVAQTGLVIDGDGVHRPDVGAVFPPKIESALGELTERLRKQPFAAADGPELAAAGLTERHLAAAARAGRLLRVATGVYLLADAAQEAVRRLREIPQPFTMSEARQALGTTRRVALPLLELLDREHDTVRVDSQRRTVR
jgi:selenocysteine-specific elongation factor